MHLADIFKHSWHGHASVYVPEPDGIHSSIQLDQVRLRFDAETLTFSCQLDPDGNIYKALARAYRRRLNFPILLRNVHLKPRKDALVTWHLHAEELTTNRSNPLSEWPDGDVFFGSPTKPRLCLQPRHAQQIHFKLLQPCSVNYGIWYDNWDQRLWLPHACQLSNSVVFWRSHANTASANGTENFFAHEPAMHLALQLACGAHLIPRVRLTPNSCSFAASKRVYRSDLPMATLDDLGAGRAFIGDLLDAAIQLSENEVQKLRFAAAWSLEAKLSTSPLELRYLCLMTCIEFLDGKYTLDDRATACLLGVDVQVAKLINSMRNQLTHAKEGGGHAAAFQAVLQEQFQGQSPTLPEPWSSYMTREGAVQTLKFEYFFFQVCERVDAMLCSRLRGNARNSPVALLPLPGPYQPPVDLPRSRSTQAEDELLNKNQKLQAQLDSCRVKQKEVIRIKDQKIRELERRVQELGG